MTKTKSNFLIGTIILVISNLITKVIGAIYRVPLLHILGSEGLGQYQMILPLFALFLVVSSSGIVVTLSKFVSKEAEHNNIRNAKMFLICGIVISLICSVLLSILLIVLVPTISKYQKSSGLYVSYLAIIPAVVFGSLLSVFRGYFLGKKQMIYSGTAQVVESVTKLVFSLMLSFHFAKQSSLMAVFGALIGISLSEIVSFAFILILYFSQKKNEKKFARTKLCKKNIVHNLQRSSKVILNQNYAKYFSKVYSKNRYLSFFQAFKKVLGFSFFVMLQASISPLISAIDSIIIVPLLLKTGIIHSVAYSLYGIENGIVSSILVLPTIVASAVGSSIIPNIKKEKNSVETVVNIKKAFNIVWITSIFCAFTFVLFSGDITKFLYGSGLESNLIDELAISSDLLRINGFNILYICLLSISTSILQGLEKNRTPVVNLATAGILRLFLMLVLI